MTLRQRYGVLGERAISAVADTYRPADHNNNFTITDKQLHSSGPCRPAAVQHGDDSRSEVINTRRLREVTGSAGDTMRAARSSYGDRFARRWAAER